MVSIPTFFVESPTLEIVTVRRPKPKQGSRGTPKTRKMQRNFANQIFKMSDGLTVTESAKTTGLTEVDIKNLRSGNMPSLTHIVRIVRKNRVTPESLVSTGPLKKLKPSLATKGAQERLIIGRIRKLAKSKPAAELAKSTGLSINSIYQLRGADARVGFHVLVAFYSAGYSASEMLLGGK